MNPAPTALGTTKAFFTKGGCSETLFYLLNRAHGLSLPVEEKASGPLSGGLLQHGYQCGQVWGAALAAGAEAHRRYGTGPLAEAKAIHAARRAVEVFQKQNAFLDCFELTALDKKASTLRLFHHFLIKGGTFTCVRIATRYASRVGQAIDEALSEPMAEIPEGPVSCAALLVRRMGGSDAQAVMAAGLAGGIGLCGGACGALGAALWFQGVQHLRSGATHIPFKGPEALELLERFEKALGSAFECTTLVGRTFANPSDHAQHLRQGGCAALLETLSCAGRKAG